MSLKFVNDLSVKHPWNDKNGVYAGMVNAAGKRHGPGKTTYASIPDKGSVEFCCYDNDVPEGVSLYLDVDGSFMMCRLAAGKREGLTVTWTNLMRGFEVYEFEAGQLKEEETQDREEVSSKYMAEWQESAKESGFIFWSNLKDIKAKLKEHPHASNLPGHVVFQQLNDSVEELQLGNILSKMVIDEDTPSSAVSSVFFMDLDYGKLGVPWPSKDDVIREAAMLIACRQEFSRDKQIQERFVVREKLSSSCGDNFLYTGWLLRNGRKSGPCQIIYVEGSNIGGVEYSYYKNDDNLGAFKQTGPMGEVLLGRCSLSGKVDGITMMMLDGTKVVQTFQQGALIDCRLNDEEFDEEVAKWKVEIVQNGFVLGDDLALELNYELLGVPAQSSEDHEMELLLIQEIRENAGVQLRKIKKSVRNFEIDFPSSGEIFLYTGGINFSDNRQGAGRIIYKKGFIVGDILYAYHDNGIAEGPFVQVSEGFRLIGTFKHDKIDGPAVLIKEDGAKSLQIYQNGIATSENSDADEVMKFLKQWFEDFPSAGDGFIMKPQFGIDLNYETIGLSRPTEEEEAQEKELIRTLIAEYSQQKSKVVEYVQDKKMTAGLYTGGLNCFDRETGPGTLLRIAAGPDQGEVVTAVWLNGEIWGPYLLRLLKGHVRLAYQNIKHPNVNSLLTILDDYEYVQNYEGEIDESPEACESFLKAWQEVATSSGLRVLSKSSVDLDYDAMGLHVPTAEERALVEKMRDDFRTEAFKIVEFVRRFPIKHQGFNCIYTGGRCANGQFEGPGRATMLEGPFKGNTEFAQIVNGNTTGAIRVDYATRFKTFLLGFKNIKGLLHGPAILINDNHRRRFLLYEDNICISRSFDQEQVAETIEKWRDEIVKCGFVLTGEFDIDIDYARCGVEPASEKENQEFAALQQDLFNQALANSTRIREAFFSKTIHEEGNELKATGAYNMNENRQGPQRALVLKGRNQGMIECRVYQDGVATGPFLQIHNSGNKGYGYLDAYGEMHGDVCFVENGQKIFYRYLNGSQIEGVDDFPTFEEFDQQWQESMRKSGFVITSNDNVMVNFEFLGIPSPSEAQLDAYYQFESDFIRKTWQDEMRIANFVTNEEIVTSDGLAFLTAGKTANGSVHGAAIVEYIEGSGDMQYVLFDNGAMAPSAYALIKHKTGEKLLMYTAPDSSSHQRRSLVIQGQKRRFVVGDDSIAVEDFIDEWKSGMAAQGFRVLDDFDVELDRPSLFLHFED